MPFYTVWQRRGLGIAHSKPLYVLDIDAEHNALLVGPASQLGRQRLRAKDVCYAAGRPPAHPIRVTAKLRYTGRKVGATVCPEDGGKARVDLIKPLRDITPGQAAVFYQGEVLLEGGIIAWERGDYGIRAN